MKKLESSLKNMTLVLTSVSIISALLLAVMNEITKEPIAIIEQQNLENGIKKVTVGDNYTNKISVTTSTEFSDKQEFTIYKVNAADGKLIGTAVKTAVTGFSPDLTVLVGFDPQGTILGYEVLKHSETPGLGAKVNQWFQKGAKGDIIGKNIKHDKLSVKKDGGDIDAITSATITSRAFLHAVNLEYNKIFNNKTNANTGATNTHGSQSQVVSTDSTETTIQQCDTLKTE